jgi:hypothetical protein
LLQTNKIIKKGRERVEYGLSGKKRDKRLK